MVIGKILYNYDLSANAGFILGFFLIISGILLFSFGIILDVWIKMHLNTPPFEKHYHIREIILS